MKRPCSSLWPARRSSNVRSSPFSVTVDEFGGDSGARPSYPWSRGALSRPFLGLSCSVQASRCVSTSRCRQEAGPFLSLFFGMQGTQTSSRFLSLIPNKIIRMYPNPMSLRQQTQQRLQPPEPFAVRKPSFRSHIPPFCSPLSLSLSPSLSTSHDHTIFMACTGS